MLDEVNLNTGADQVTWHLEASGVFSVKSMYAKLSQGATMAHYKDVWAAVAVPLKINFFPGN
jgi:dihydrodipicolinate synthase/N-acetylneuraminate lyase